MENWTSNKEVLCQRFDTEEHGWVRERCRLCVWKWLQAVALPAQNCLGGPNTTGAFRKAQSLVRPSALILGGRLYGANIWVDYRYYFLSRYTVRPTLHWVWILVVVVTLHQWSANFFIAAQITFSTALEGPPHLKPLEQNELTKRIRHRQYATAV